MLLFHIYYTFIIIIIIYNHNKILIYHFSAIFILLYTIYINNIDGLEGQGLRYGKVMIMCDQDTDGSHIKGTIVPSINKL